MKKKDIKQMLKAEIEQNTPDVLDRVLSTPVEIEEIKQTINDTPNVKKPYFQFRYLYVTFAVCVMLVIGLGFLAPSVQNKGLLQNNEEQSVYNITTTISLGNTNIQFVYTTSNKITSYKITKDGENMVVDLTTITTLDKALDYAIEYLSEDLNDALTIRLNVSASENKYTEENYNQVKTIFHNKLTAVGFTNIQIIK